MEYGLFMMPLHDPRRDYTGILEEDREAILLAEKLGFAEAWVGEHYSARTEPIPDPLQFMATLIPQTKNIKFATGVINIPQHNPAMIAGNVAQFDHLCRGRYIMGVGPGGLGSDFELFKVFDKNRSEMMLEAIDMVHKIWASDPPYRIHGQYWDVVVDEQCQLHLGVGPMLKPYQKPYPPLAVSWCPRTSCRSATRSRTGTSTASAPSRPAAGRIAPTGASPAPSW
jgi:alkanesulfonate monooxygenase SsuD/methylene tetrahydromethanopterin reductase-like flavin-dependent oxidoreductase (luciferase family)